MRRRLEYEKPPSHKQKIRTCGAKKRSTIGAGNEKNAAMNVVVIRHPRENLKKCSLRHLHGRPNFEFLTASDGFSFDASGFTLLEIGAPEMSPADADRPVLLLDSTWHLLPRIRNKVFGNFVSRSLPPSIKTAYPRVSKMHSDPHGLATVEALYAALKFAGTPDIEILRGYMFAPKFLQLNGWLSDAPDGFFDTPGRFYRFE